MTDTRFRLYARLWCWVFLAVVTNGTAFAFPITGTHQTVEGALALFGMCLACGFAAGRAAGDLARAHIRWKMAGMGR